MKGKRYATEDKIRILREVGFVLATGWGDGVFVDIETEMEFTRFHGVVVSSR